MLILFIIIFYAAVYVLLIVYINWKWLNIPEFIYKENNHNLPFLSIIVAARNESENINKCLRSIHQNQYPEDRYEILLADDHSEDNTIRIASELNITNLKIIQLPEEYKGKKAAIHEAIGHAQGEIFIFTDADCVVQKNWLTTLQSAFDSDHVQMVTGPVITQENDTLLKRFQQLDFAATMGITAVAIENNYFPLANGANMAYRKSFYLQSGGMESHSQLSSGDDVFMAEKAFYINHGGLKFLKSKNAIVQTKSENTWSSLMQQRKRWAGKAVYYKNQKMNLFQSFVVGFCSLIPLSLLMGFIISPYFGFIATGLFMVKMITDYFYLSNMTRWFNAKAALQLYPLSSSVYLLHIFYSAWWAMTSIKTVLKKGSWK